jgi:xylan 1,4-beta-xylosidase
VNFEGALTRAFEFENQPWFAGFRALASNGVDLPVLNVFRMFSKMGGRRAAVQSDAAIPLDQILRAGVRAMPDVSALAGLETNRLCVLLWHYHDDDLTGPDADVRLELEGLPARTGTLQTRHFRIDRAHSNAYTVWQRMGSPQSPTPEQVAELEQAGQLASIPAPSLINDEASLVTARFNLPRQAVSLLVFEWNPR